MNEKLQYATMLEIPVNTCNVTFQPTKKRKTRRKKDVNPEAVKQQLMNKINAEEQPLEEREEIANALGISTTTVLTHLNAIYNKINEDRIAGIVNFYWQELR